jgi:2'-5'-oligoadenylate synthetase
VVSLKGANVEQVLPQTANANDNAPAASMPPPGLDMPAEADDIPAPIENQQYLDLHNRICGRSFNSKVAQTLNDIVETVSGLSFLNVDRVVKGGSVAKGSAVTGVSDAEIVFFLNGLPTTGHDKWLPPLLRATAGVLAEQLTSEQGVDGVTVTDDSVNMKVKGIITVDIRFSPVFESFVKVIQSIGSQGPEVRRFYLPSLVQERTQFIAKQPGHVKVTIRLLKWWRDQQTWSNKLVRPSDDTLELLTVYSAVQTRPTDQRIAVANVMLLLSQFNDLQIVWSNYYSKEDVWAPLLRQRPLLMDPTNPFINIADPQLFDAREMMSLAKTTRFFW